MSRPAALPVSASTALVTEARRVLPVAGADWPPCRRDGTRIDPAGAEVVLAVEPAVEPIPEPAPDPTTCCPTTPASATAPAPEPEAAGLAFDRIGCLYRGVPERGQVQRMPWPAPGEPVDLLGGPLPTAPAEAGVGFTPVGADPARPLRARALAADVDEHLFVLDGATSRVAVLDLVDGHQLRTVAFPAVPVDLAGPGRTVVVLTTSRTAPLWRLDAIGQPERVALPDTWAAGVPAGARPARVATGPDGAVWVLLRRDDDAYLVRALPGAAGPGPVPVLAVPGARDVELDGRRRPVVAGLPGAELTAWTLTADGWLADSRLRARGYDGRGLVRTPDGRVGYATARAFRVAVAERVRYRTAGTVDTRRLDGLSYGLQWGRVFVEACVPPDTTLRFAARTTDEAVVATGSADPGFDDGTVFDVPDADGLRLRPLHRRETGRELAWAPLAAGDRYEVYEAPIVAPAGRFLRVRLALSGTGASTPRVRALRIEIPGRDLVAKLPRTYRRDPAGADLLRRFLAIVDGQLGDLESRAVRRDLLLDPWGAPPELLPWLASLVGLTLDARWPERARRIVLAEAMTLFRTRGTIAGLRRLLEIYLGSPVVIVEAFRLRGRPAPIGGATGPPGPFDAVLGGGWRVAGGPGPATAGPAPAIGATRATAHRFTVLLTCDPDEEQLAAVRDLLDVHRPAHTLVEVCSLGAGMRLGVNLYVELSTYIGAGSGFRPLRVGPPASGTPCTPGCRPDGGPGTPPGDGVFGRDGVLGRGRAGVRPGMTRLGPGTVIDT